MVSTGANELVVAPETITADVLLLSLEIPIEVVAAAARAAAAAATPVLLNAAPARELPAALLTDVDVLVVNEGELAALGGDALALLDQGPDIVVVTLGGRGCRVVTREGSEHVAAVSAPVVDTTGAGDCFTAALAYGVASGWDITRSAALATAAAGRSVTVAGARGGHPTLSEALAHLG